MKKQTDSKPPSVKAEKPERNERGKYSEKLAVNGSFLDIIGAAIKDAKGKAGKKKKGEQ